MALGKRERQLEAFIAASDLPQSPGRFGMPRQLPCMANNPAGTKLGAASRHEDSPARPGSRFGEAGQGGLQRRPPVPAGGRTTKTAKSPDSHSLNNCGSGSLALR